MANKRMLIVGAGPSGMAAALFLHQSGVDIQLVDKADKPTSFSRAFGVNPRTLTLLEKTGATDLFLANGRRMQGINLYRNSTHLARIDFTRIDPRYPFMLVQSQADSEAILARLLTEQGLKIQRGIELTDVANEADQVVASVLGPDGSVGTISADYLFGADGSRSAVRKSLSLNFPGDSFEEKWLLYDVALHVPLNEDEAHTFILDQGALFMVRIRDNVWRVLGNVANLLEHLPKGTQVGPVTWQSEYGIGHRIVERFQVGRIFLGGDAAHIHAAIGARGMNLGIEDAYVFAHLYQTGRLDQYQARRSQVVANTVAHIHRQIEFMRGRTLTSRAIRQVGKFVIPPLFPFFEQQVATFTLGLDHAV